MATIKRGRAYSGQRCAHTPHFAVFLCIASALHCSVALDDAEVLTASTDCASGLAAGGRVELTACADGSIKAVAVSPLSCPSSSSGCPLTLDGGAIVETRSGSAFLRSLSAEVGYPESSGNTRYLRNIQHRCDKVVQAEVGAGMDEVGKRGEIVWIRGTLGGNSQCEASFNLTLRAYVNDGSIQVEVKTEVEKSRSATLPSSSTSTSASASFFPFPSPHLPAAGVEMTFVTHHDEAFVGFGAQYSKLDWGGDVVQVLTREQGVGRGRQPLTDALNAAEGFSGGNRHTTYAPMAASITSACRSFRASHTLPGEVDLTHSHGTFGLRPSASLRFFEPLDASNGGVEANKQGVISGALTFTAACSPAELVQVGSQVAGRMQPLPSWAGEGICVGTEGNADDLHGNITRLRKGFSAPITSVWLQDWVGSMALPWGEGLRWQWEPSSSPYGDWAAFVRDLYEKEGIRTLSYINPMLRQLDAPYEGEESMYAYANRRGYFVQLDDHTVWTGYANASLIDLTNPAAVEWYKQVIISMLEGGVSGWMCDFAEALPIPSSPYSGSAAQLKNNYPLMWAKLNRVAIHDFFSRCAANSTYASLHWPCHHFAEEEIVYFMRAASPTSPGYTSLFWLGDQLATFDGHDGLQSALVGLQSTSLSGMAIEHSDIGGFNAIQEYGFNIHRTKEVFLRWCEFAAFTSFYRTHLGTSPTGNWQFYSDDDTSAGFVKMGKLFRALREYRYALMKEASSSGLPVNRPVLMEFPNDKEVWKSSVTETEAMLGDALLFAPALADGIKEVKVYLPPSAKWSRLYVGKECESSGALSDSTVFLSGWVRVDAVVGCPAAFVRHDMLWSKHLLALSFD